MSSRKKKAHQRELQKQKLKKLGVDHVKVYYNTIPIIGNIFTACLFLDKNKDIISRGITVCSPLDIFNKEEGRKRAYKRAMKAIYIKNNSFPINSFPLRWGGETVERQFKMKSEEDEKLAFEYVQPTLGLVVSPKNIKMSINTFHKKVKRPNKEDKVIEIKRLDYSLPRETMIYLTSREFEYKSYYKPQPTRFERRLLKKE